jgi:hypothetical protein
VWGSMGCYGVAGLYIPRVEYDARIPALSKHKGRCHRMKRKQGRQIVASIAARHGVSRSTTICIG